MRRPLTFDCHGATLAGVLHPAAGDTGVVIVSGGVQTRAGSHRGFVDLADRLAAAGHPTLRFDRRGVGDSDGSDQGFSESAPDIAAAITALRRSAPQVHRVVGWGLCDGAAALLLTDEGFGLDALILANPWTRDPDSPAAMPPRAAVAVRYRQRLTSARQWGRLLRGGFDLRKAMQGLLSFARAEPIPRVALLVAAGMRRFEGPMLVLLSGRDATAQAFNALWRSDTYRAQRARQDIAASELAEATHTFAGAKDAARMADNCIEWMRTTNIAARDPASPVG